MNLMSFTNDERCDRVPADSPLNNKGRRVRERGLLCLAVGELKVNPTGFWLHANDDDETLAADDIQGLAVIVCARVQQS